MAENIAIQKVRWEDEDRFMLVSRPDRQYPSDPVMRTSDAMTKEEIIKLFRDRGLPESEIKRLLTAAEGENV